MEEKSFCYKYPHPALTTDCIIFGVDRNELRVLLIKRGSEPYKNLWAFPGGFLEISESAETGALRELKEETGLENVYIEQFHSFSDPDRDPRERVISIAFLSVVEICKVKAGDDAEEASWFPIDNLPHLAFDHQVMFDKAFSYLKERIYLFKTGFLIPNENLNPKVLQTLYEIFK